VSEGRRNEFAAYGWDPSDIPDPQNPQTFQRSKLTWEEPGREPHRSILAWHKRLIELRRSLPALKDGRLDRVCVDWDEEKKWIVMARGPVSVACNIAPHAQTVPLRKSPGKILLASEEGISLSGGGIELPADSVGICG
jgi:maltooligosyltrehalose trehalohydrolase